MSLWGRSPTLCVAFVRSTRVLAGRLPLRTALPDTGWFASVDSSREEPETVDARPLAGEADAQTRTRTFDGSRDGNRLLLRQTVVTGLGIFPPWMDLHGLHARPF